MKRTIALVAAVVLIGVAAPGGAYAAAEIAFDGGAQVTVAPGGSASVALTNDTATAREVTLGVVDSDGRPTTNVQVPRSVTLPAGGVATVRLTAARTDGEFTGYVLATTGATGPVARQKFVIRQALALEPLVDKWRATSYRMSGSTRDDVLPLKPGQKCPGEPASTVVGGLVRGGGGGTTVTAQCTAAGVRLSFSDLSAIGDYTGTLDLAPDDDKKGAVALTVRRTDTWWPPLLALIAGVLLALLATRQSGRLNTLAKAEEELLLVEATASRAVERFKARAGTAAWSAYALDPAWATKAREVTDSLKGLRRRFGALDEKDATYQAVVTDIATMRRVAEAWPAFADRLADLEPALAAVTTLASGNAPPRSGQSEPAFLAPARALLTGEPLAFDAILDRVAEVEATAALARRWPEDAATVRQLEERADVIEAAIHDAGPDARPDLGKLSEARQLTSQARHTMWEARTPKDYQVAAGLKAADALLDGLSFYLHDDGDLVPAGFGIGRVFRRRTAPASDLSHTLDAPLRKLRRVSTVRWVGNLLVFLVTLAVTVVSGLAVWYEDKPFGTFSQYATLVLWGFTAQAALTALAAALDPLLERRRELPG
ncbi:DUF4402 domain-containing protein [Nucisporomicrobium flavum]|uniref:DUF4402 domain-containing protein n=1 Tax=Nucisporomicrobium flavum TaxID=2785915 RepID=UPI003C2E6024